jgi:arylsulfatase A-like enzyme
MVGGISDIRVAPYPVKTLPANALPVFTLYHRASVYCARSRRWTLALNYNVGGLDPGEDPRTPDIIVTPNEGMTYSGSTTMIGDHGGFAHDDTNVVMLVANPHFSPRTVSAAVTTAQVAPTIVQALGLEPTALDAVRAEGTPVLPEVIGQIPKK